MTEHRRAIHERRANLQARAAAERDEMAALVGQWRRPLAVLDRGERIVKGVIQHAPLIGTGITAGFVALAVARPSRVSDWFQRGERILRFVSQVRALIR